jgi:hypothetical protein
MIVKAFSPRRLRILRDHEESAVAGAERGGREAQPVPRGRIAPGERGAEIYRGSSFLSVYDSSFGGHQ